MAAGSNDALPQNLFKVQMKSTADTSLSHFICFPTCENRFDVAMTSDVQHAHCSIRVPGCCVTLS